MTITRITMAELLAGDVRARLADLLSSVPRPIVAISCHNVPRVPVTALVIAMQVVTETGGFLRLDGVSPHVLQALQVVDPGRLLAVEDATRVVVVGESPFQVSAGIDGRVHVLLSKGAGHHPHMAEAASHEWIRGLEVTTVVIDLSQLEHLNSLLVAWLLQLNQGAGTGRCQLVNVSRQATTQLTQLRLNHLLSIS